MPYTTRASLFLLQDARFVISNYRSLVGPDALIMLNKSIYSYKGIPTRHASFSLLNVLDGIIKGATSDGLVS